MKIKPILAYLVTVAVSVLFMLYLDGPGGSYLLIVLLLSAVLSVALCLYTKRSVSVKLSVSEDVLNKGDVLLLTVSVKKRGFLPSAVFCAELFASDHLAPRSPLTLKAVCLGRNECLLKAEFSARYFGKAKLGLSAFTVSDYLGLCTFHIPVRGGMLDARIYPDLPEIHRKDGFARSLTDAAAFDDSEETTESLFAFQGSPGYDHRLYEPGDSLKLINWKLSAKREELYVRRIEGVGGAEQIFILDKMGGDREREQLVAESMLGLIAQFARSELPVKLLIRFSESWEEVVVANYADLNQLRYTLTNFGFLSEGVNRFPTSFSGGRAVIFSVSGGVGLLSYMAELTALGKDCSAAVATETAGNRLWRIEREDAVVRFVG
ncbi:MAG: DUF58 domain-containing protein [Bacteroides sp.]|nr:DUF58 domain-containing protein [Eubacterium sp.]MCM1418091.1 DUF58 domain-containing protein [Roseburia sp.]MCM1462235.1 DUF58 domain-containing protein [Bacteroides sp.]